MGFWYNSFHLPFYKNSKYPSVNSFIAHDTPVQHFLNFIAPASEMIRKQTLEMAQEEEVNVRVDPLGDDDAEELAARYRTETRMVGVGDPVGQS